MAVSSPLAERGSSAPLRARLGYLEPGIERPVSYAAEPPPGVPWENAGYDQREMAIADGLTWTHPTTFPRCGAAVAPVQPCAARRAYLCASTAQTISWT
jgi:hypothetical protein